MSRIMENIRSNTEPGLHNPKLPALTIATTGIFKNRNQVQAVHYLDADSSLDESARTYFRTSTATSIGFDANNGSQCEREIIIYPRAGSSPSNVALTDPGFQVSWQQQQGFLSFLV
jgi:hypothetical protein